jgi:hypothetical protein
MSGRRQEMLAKLYSSYVDGVRVPPPEVTLDKYEMDLHQQLYSDLQSRLGAMQIKLMKRCTAAYSKGLESAREGEIELACGYFGQARLLCKSPDLSEEGRTFGLSFLAAAESYLDYRCADFDGAQQRLYESLARDEILEITYGHKNQHVHRLHLVNNLIRVEIQRGNIDGALKCSTGLLSYMQGESDNVPAPGRWGKSYRDQVTPELITSMFVQAVGELGLALMGSKPEAARTLFAEVERGLPQPDAAVWHPLALAWFNAKRAYVGGDIEQYLKLSADYLAKGVGVAPALWRMIALDVVIAVDDLPFAESVELRKEILRDALTWSGASRKMRCLVTDLAAEFQYEAATRS